MHLWLIVEGGLIKRAAYGTYGCPAAAASGSMLAEVLCGRTLQQAKQVRAIDIMQLLGGLPEGREHCAELAEKALRKAVRVEECERPRV
jgi:nitrogen fixation protein NifU and related proteins